jgi:hypothetical protein
MNTLQSSQTSTFDSGRQRLPASVSRAESPPAKKRVTRYLDVALIEHFKAMAGEPAVEAQTKQGLPVPSVHNPRCSFL